MKILFPVDGSEYSDGAAKFLSRLNLSAGDEITILHVVHFVPFLNEIRSYYDTIFQIKQEIAPRILDGAVNILKSTPATLSTAVLEGDIDNSIVSAAVDADVDMIVLGAKGSKGVKSFIIGSVTRSLALNSPVPVLVIKRAQWDSSARVKVLFATDGSEYADAAGKFLMSLPLHTDTEIKVLNVISSSVQDIPERFFIEIDDRMKDEVAKVRTMEFAESEKIIHQTKEYLHNRYPHADGLTRVGDPSIEIITAAEHLKTDLIVIGCRGLKGIKGKLGKVPRDILRHAKCSFLIGKLC